jgi:hypothetical protein
VAQAHQAPGLQLLQAHADVAAAELQRLGDLVGVQRLGRDVDQRVDLPHRAVDAPAAAHLAEVADEAKRSCGPRPIDRCPLLVAPAMNREMWAHPATQRNVAQLRADGATVLGPGALATRPAARSATAACSKPMNCATS